MATDDDFEDEEFEEIEDDELDDDLEIDLDDEADDVPDVEEDDEVDEVEAPDLDEDDDDELEEESLDVLLARDQGLSDTDLTREDPREGLGLTTVPPGAGEFTCQSCFLVKRRAQLADEKRMICFDCA